LSTQLQPAANQLRHAQQHPLLARGRLPAPAPVEEGGASRSHRVVRLPCGCRRNPRYFSARGRIKDRLRLRAVSWRPAFSRQHTVICAKKILRRLRHFVQVTHKAPPPRPLVQYAG